MTVIKEGELAPKFSLSAGPGQVVNLTDLHGQNVILAFYPADWSPVCSNQLALYNELLPEFQTLNATLLGISVDSLWCHAAFRQHCHLQFPLLADFEPKGQTAKAYGVYNASKGITDRALFVIDGQGIVQWSHVFPSKVNPGADGILSALEKLSHQSSVH